MLKFRNGAPVVFAAAALLVTAGQARADLKSEVQSAYDKISRAFLNEDVRGIMAMSAPGFTYKHKNGMVEKGEQMMAQLKSEFAKGMDVTKMEMRVMSVKNVNGQAVAMGSGHGEMRSKGPDGKMHVMVDKSVSRDVLVKTKGGWKFKSVEVLRSTMTMDGKPFDPYAMMNPGTPKK